MAALDRLSRQGLRFGLALTVVCFAVAYATHAQVIPRPMPLPRPTPTIFYANSSSTYHAIGQAASSTSWSVASTSPAGYLTYGPYTNLFQNGVYTAAFRLRVDNNSADNQSIGSLDVHDAVTGQILAHQEFHRKEFTSPMVFQDITLTFYTTGSNSLEFRVYYNGFSYLEHAQTAILPVSSFASPDLLFTGNDSSNFHQIGYASGTAWVTDVTRGQGYMTYGPYTASVPTGNSTATFSLMVDNNSADNGTVIRLEAYDTSTAQVLAYRIINRKDFTAAMTAQDFDLVFELSTAATMEFRVWAYGISYIQHLQTLIRPDRLTLGSLWGETNHFEYRTRDTWGNTDNEGSTSLVTLDGIWYAFNRQPINFAGCPSQALQTVVRQSVDRGVTWSANVVVASPSTNGAGLCIITDGGVFFDTETDTWHMLYQCLAASTTANPSPGWNMCHYSRTGISPMGAFAADAANPVVTGGELWSQICSGSGKACPLTMKDEGTAQIVSKVGGYYYVTFHGANYGFTITGARGVARTTDFVHWQVSGADLPDNAILSATDCSSWAAQWNAGGCIGTGNARILRSGGYNYILAEAADDSLGCTAGQHWVFGLLRSTVWSSSGAWEEYPPSNPFVTNGNLSPVGCALQYQSLFRDRGDIFLTFSLYSPDYAFPNYTFELVSGTGQNQILVR